MEKRMVTVNFYANGDQIESVVMLNPYGGPIGHDVAFDWLNRAYSSSSKVKWAFIGSLEVEIESVSTHKISAKVMP